MGRAPCCDKANVKKGPWSPEEDARLKSYIEQHGIGGNWIALPQKIGLKRCGKSCRLRWLNYLRPNIKHGSFSEEEDNIICSLYINIGSRWSIIAGQLPGRTDNDIKNYWNTRLKKKLLGCRKRKDQNYQQGRPRAGGSKAQAEAKREEEINGTDLPINHGGAGALSSTCPSTYWPKAYATVPMCPLQQAYGASALINPSMSTDFNPSTELDEMFGCGSTKLEGLDCFYGLGNVVDDNSGTGTTDTVNWSEVSSLIYQPMVEPSYQGIMQPCLFEEAVQYLGS